MFQQRTCDVSTGLRMRLVACHHPRGAVEHLPELVGSSALPVANPMRTGNRRLRCAAIAASSAARAEANAAHTPSPKRPPATMEYMTTAIVVTTLGLLGLGIVVNELLRLKKWLKNSPASNPVDDEAQEPPEET
jgi:hypothetical protein